VNAFIPFSLSRHGLLAAALAALLLGPGAALGAEPEQNATREAAATELPTVVVTAQKREENVQKIPMSLTVVPDDELNDSGVRDTSELMRYIPNPSCATRATTTRQHPARGGFITSLPPPLGLYVDDENCQRLHAESRAVDVSA
jgi:hypothetical protein